MVTKICKICKIEKPVVDYFFCKRRQVYYSHCKKCNTERAKINRNKRKDEYNKKRKEKRVKYKEYEKIYRKKYYEEKIKPKNTGERKKYKWKKKKTKEEWDLYHAEYRRKNREKLKIQAREYRINKAETIRNNNIRRYQKRTVSDKIKQNLRGRIRSCIKRKSNSSMELLGCSIEYLCEYLESKFTKGMTWNNYGLKGWHIDHIIPCSSFDFTNSDEQKKCFHYTNLQPLWGTTEIAISYGENKDYVGNIEKSNLFLLKTI